MNRIKNILGWLKSKLIYEWNPLKIRRKKNFFKNFIAKGDLCFDVGSHLGDRADTMIYLGAKVIAIEPQPKFIKYLSNKFRNNKSFILESVAISDQVGIVDFHISSANPTLSTLSKGWWQDQMNQATRTEIKFDTVIKTEVTTLDLLIDKYGLPTFIKIDVEGYEEQVLNGLNHHPKYISFEFLSFNKEALKKCLTILEKKGYRSYNWSFRETFKMEFENWTTLEKVYNSINNYKSNVFSGDVYVIKE